MFETIVSSILDRYVGAYVEGIDTSKLSIGFGAIVLKNLKLDTAALAKMGLPVIVKAGYIGTIRVEIPWSNPLGRPVHITISDIFAVVTPQSEFKYDEKKEGEIALSSKWAELAKREAERTAGIALKELQESGKTESTTYSSRLLSQILDNIQIKVEYVHLRYEDRSSLKKRPFAIGLCCALLQIQTTDAGGKSGSEREKKRNGLLHKKLTLKHVAVYVDPDLKDSVRLDTNEDLHKDMMGVFGVVDAVDDSPSSSKRSAADTVANESQGQRRRNFILQPVDGCMQMAINDTKTIDKKEHALMDLKISLDPVSIRLGKAQYAATLSAADALSNYKMYAMYRRDRPNDGLRPLKGKNARAWWRYAISAVRLQVRERARRRSWARVIRLCGVKTEYVSLFAHRLREDPQRKLRPKMAGGGDDVPAWFARLCVIEKDCVLNEIWHFRNLARSKIAHEKDMAETRRKLEQKHRELEKATKESKSWFGGWFGGGGGDEVERDEVRSAKKKELEARRAADKANIRKMEDDWKRAQDLLAFDPDEVPFWKELKAMDKMATISFEQDAVQVQLLDDDDDSAALATLSILGVRVSTCVRSSYFEAAFRIQDIRAYDSFTNHTLCRNVVERYELAELRRQHAGSSKIDAVRKALPPLFDVSVAFPPLPPDVASCKVRAKMSKLEARVSMPLVSRLAKFFAVQPVNLDALRDIVLDQVAKLRQQSSLSMEEALEKYQSLDLEAELHVGRLLLPSDPREIGSDKPMLVTNMGVLTASTSKTTVAEQRAEGYDQIRIGVTDVQMLLVDDEHNFTSAKVQKSERLELVERLEMKTDLCVSIHPTPGRPTATAISTLSDVRIDFTAKKYAQIVKLVEGIVSYMPSRSDADVARLKRSEKLRKARRKQWRSCQKEMSEVRARRDSQLEDMESARQSAVASVEKTLARFGVSYVVVRPHHLPPLSSERRVQRINDAGAARALKTVEKAGGDEDEDDGDAHVSARRIVQMQQQAVEGLTSEALTILQKNVIAQMTLRMPLLAITISGDRIDEEIVTLRVTKLGVDMTKRTFDTCVEADLCGIFIYDNVRERRLRAEKESCYLCCPMRPSAASAARSLDSKFAKLSLRVLEPLSPDFAKAPASVDLALEMSGVHWIVDRHTLASLIRFVTHGLKKVNADRAARGQRLMAKRAALNATRSIEMMDVPIVEANYKRGEDAGDTRGVEKKEEKTEEDAVGDDLVQVRLRTSLGVFKLTLVEGSVALTSVCAESFEMSLARTSFVTSVDCRIGRMRLRDLSVANIPERNLTILDYGGRDSVPVDRGSKRDEGKKSDESMVHLSLHVVDDESRFYRGYSVGAKAAIGDGVILTFTNRFVQELMLYGTTGPMVEALKEMSAAPVVKSAMEVATETAQEVRQAASDLASRRASKAVKTGGIAGLPKFDVKLGRMTVFVPTASDSRDGVCAKISYLNLSNSKLGDELNDLVCRTESPCEYSPSALSKIRLAAKGLCIETLLSGQRRGLLGRVDSLFSVHLEKQKISCCARVTAVRLAVSQTQVRALCLTLPMGNLREGPGLLRKSKTVADEGGEGSRVDARGVAHDNSGSKWNAASKRDSDMETTSQIRSLVPDHGIKVAIAVEGVAVQLVHGDGGYDCERQPLLWGVDMENQSPKDYGGFHGSGLLAFEMSSCSVNANVAKTSSLDVADVSIRMSLPKMNIFDIAPRKGAVNVSDASGKSTSSFSDGLLRLSVGIGEKESSSSFAVDARLKRDLSAEGVQTIQVKIPKLCATMFGDVSRNFRPLLRIPLSPVDVKFSYKKMVVSPLSVSIQALDTPDAASWSKPQIIEIADELATKSLSFLAFLRSTNTRRPSPSPMQVTVHVSKFQFDLVDSLGVLDGGPRKKSTFIRAVIEDVRVSLTQKVSGRQIVDAGISNFGLFKLANTTKLMFMPILTMVQSKISKKTASSVSKTPVSAVCVRAAFQSFPPRNGDSLPPMRRIDVDVNTERSEYHVKVDTKFVSDVLVYVDSTEEEGRAKKSDKDSDIVEEYPATKYFEDPFVHLSPKFEIRSIDFRLWVRHNSDLHTLMHHLKIVGKRHGFVEPLIYVLNIFGSLIGNIKNAHLVLGPYRLKDEEVRADLLVSRIVKHYSDEFASPDKWVKIAEKCGALGAIQVLTGAASGIHAFGAGFVNAAKTGDVTNIVKGTTALVGNTLGGAAGGITSVLSAVENGLDTVGGNSSRDKEAAEAGNIIEGVVGGVGGIGKALGRGISGFVTKNKDELAKTDGSVIGTVGAVTKGTGKAAVGFVTGTIGSVVGAARSTVEGASNTTKKAGKGWLW
eukprot:g3436.t1